MPIVNRIADYHDEMKEWRQHIHKNPELNFDCHSMVSSFSLGFRLIGTVARVNRYWS